MPIMYAPDPFGLDTGPETLTEQEHKDSCNINIMLKRAQNGQPIRISNSQPIYGHDDLTVDGLQHRINMKEAIDSLEELGPQAELTEEQLNAIPEKDRKRFGFKAKQFNPPHLPQSKAQSENDDDLNDDETPEPPTPKKTLKKS